MADAGVTGEDATALLTHFEGAVDRVNAHARETWRGGAQPRPPYR
jgi:hypothetical protein